MSAPVATDASKFTWTRNWWPAIPLSYLDPTRPTPLEILGIPLVIWQDGSGTWRCFKDMCPHRLAPLSEGRVEGGELMCSYHGWKFGGEGSCSTIPQAPDAKAQAVATASPRSCALAFPVQEAGGLLWVWPDEALTSWVDSAAAELPLCNAAKAGPHAAKLAGDWFLRELPYDYDVLVENLTDPSHLPFSHHKVAPILSRYKVPPMPFTPAAEEVFNPSSLDATAQDPVCSFTFPSSFGPTGRISFHAPSLVTYVYSGAWEQMLTLYMVPVAPGRSRAITAASLRDMTGTANTFSLGLLLKPALLQRFFVRKLLARLPPWPSHLTSQKLFDGDGVFLSIQSRVLRAKERLQQAEGGKEQEEGGASTPTWASAYFMPMSCDRAVVAARKWIDSVGGGGPTYSPDATPAPAMATRQQLLDRYEQHTKHCPHCRGALDGAGRVAAVCKALLAASFLALCCCASHWGPARLIAGGLPSVATVATIAFGVISALVGNICKKLSAQFYFTDHVHADNH